MIRNPFSPQLLRIARKVVWYDDPEQTLANKHWFLSHLMVYGSVDDVTVVSTLVSDEEFIDALMHAPAGVFTQDAWIRWHRRFGLPISQLPRRQFPDGTLGPEAGGFFGR